MQPLEAAIQAELVAEILLDEDHLLQSQVPAIGRPMGVSQSFSQIMEVIPLMNNDDIVPGFDEGKDDSVKLKLQRIEGMEGGLVIYAIGYIDTYNSYSFQKRVDKAIEAGFVRIIFELSGISYMSSTGLATFPNFLKTVKSRKGDMVLDNVQAKVFEVIQILGLSQFFTF